MAGVYFDQYYLILERLALPTSAISVTSPLKAGYGVDPFGSAPNQDLDECFRHSLP
jgi:hypothetical protein